MRSYLPSRLCLGAALALLFAVTPALARGGAGQRAARPPAIRPNRSAPPRVDGPNAGVRAGQIQGHLPQWLENHKNLSPADQRRAMQNEPGFSELDQETQQRVLNRLDQLNSMDPLQRGRILDRNEALERMTPQQRQQYRGAVQGLASMPQDRRRAMARTILNLRDFPPGQRQQVLNSPAYRSQFSDGERSMLSTLLMAEPYHPPAVPAPAP